VKLAIVTATTDVERARPCFDSWIRYADEPPPIFLTLQTVTRPTAVEVAKTNVAWIYSEEYLGSVKAFRIGVEAALHGDYQVIACLHDDFEIQESHWDRKVLKYFTRRWDIGLLGFGGATGLGALDMYQKPYDPMSLARTGFRSDLQDAETHGVRSVLAERVACLDGFSQVGRREFWEGYLNPMAANDMLRQQLLRSLRPWQVLEDLGIVHHLYDGLLGAIAARNNWETWYVPLRAKHWGGRTAVGDPGYQLWADAQTGSEGGDQLFWDQAHRIGYAQFRDVLPLRV
jgi:hypothetical protein